MEKLIGLFLIGTLFIGCGYPIGMVSGESKLSSVASDWNTASVDPALEAKALAVLQTNCTACHGATSGSGGIYGLTNKSHLLSSGLVKAGDPNASRLYTVITSGRMPTSGPLSAADQEKIRVWIAGMSTSTTPTPSPSPSPSPTMTPMPSPSPTATPAPGDATALNILQVNCASCHTATSGPSNVYNVTNKAHLISSGLIKPGDPFNSRLFIAIQAGTMPKAGPLSANDQEIIKQFIISAGGSTPTTPPPPPATPEPKFTYLKNNIIGPKCASCHYTGSAKGGYAFDTYAGVMRAVSTSRPTDSDIYKEAQKGDMPPRPNQQLSSSELNLILQWIQLGAKND